MLKNKVKALFLLIILLLAAIITLSTVQKPQYHGRIAQEHFQYGNVIIYRDEFGIPHIDGNSFIAVSYGAGFA